MPKRRLASAAGTLEFKITKQITAAYRDSRLFYFIEKTFSAKLFLHQLTAVPMIRQPGCRSELDRPGRRNERYGKRKIVCAALSEEHNTDNREKSMRNQVF